MPPPPKPPKPNRVKWDKARRLDPKLANKPADILLGGFTAGTFPLDPRAPDGTSITIKQGAIDDARKALEPVLKKLESSLADSAIAETLCGCGFTAIRADNVSISVVSDPANAPILEMYPTASEQLDRAMSGIDFALSVKIGWVLGSATGGVIVHSKSGVCTVFCDFGISTIPISLDIPATINFTNGSTDLGLLVHIHVKLDLVVWWVYWIYFQWGVPVPTDPPPKEPHDPPPEDKEPSGAVIPPIFGTKLDPPTGSGSSPPDDPGSPDGGRTDEPTPGMSETPGSPQKIIRLPPAPSLIRSGEVWRAPTFVVATSAPNSVVADPAVQAFLSATSLPVHRMEFTRPLTEAPSVTPLRPRVEGMQSATGPAGMVTNGIRSQTCAGPNCGCSTCKED